MKFLSNRMARQIEDMLQVMTANLLLATEEIRVRDEIISSQASEITRVTLEYTRWGRDMIENFLVGLDSPEDEDELRELLGCALIDMSDAVARIEEHV